MTEVSLHSVSKAYELGTAPAVDDLTLRVEQGECAVLVGPSGCGKTTVLKLIAGLADPDGGDIRMGGRSVLRVLPERRGAVLMFQNAQLFPTMTVAQNIGFGLRMRGVQRAEIADRVDGMLARVQMQGSGERMPRDLSGGQAQRVALARAVILRPKVLLLDEPLSGLDANLRADMRDLIRSLHRENGTTMIVVTHDQEEAVTLADRVGLLLAGRLHQFGPPETFYRRPANAAVARFFETGNLIAGRSERGLFLCPLGALRLPDDAPSGSGLLTIRPEALRVRKVGDQGQTAARTDDAVGGKSADNGASAMNSLPGQVVDRAFLGTRVRLTLDVAGYALHAVMSPDQAEGIAPGDPVIVTLPPPALWVVTEPG